MKNIFKIIEQNKNKILNSNYPASTASDILVNKYNYNYNYALRCFSIFCSENNIIFNRKNF